MKVNLDVNLDLGENEPLFGGKPPRVRLCVMRLSSGCASKAYQEVLASRPNGPLGPTGNARNGFRMLGSVVSAALGVGDGGGGPREEIMRDASACVSVESGASRMLLAGSNDAARH